MPTVRVNDLTVYYELHGEGAPLVLIMGLGADISQYGWLIGHFGPGHRVVAFDNRGAGRTERPDTPYSIELMADDTAGLMRALEVGHADILGISMGGRIALELALRHPEAVGRLVLVSSAHRVVRSWRRRLLMSVIPRLPIFKGRYPQPYRAFVRQRDASGAYDGTSRLAGVRAPTLMLNGRKDRVAPFFLAEEMHRAIRGSKLLAFDGGHTFFLFGERRRFLKETADFLHANR